MSGNVWKWCLTKWRDNSWTPPDDDLGGSAPRVVRGGSFLDDWDVRCAVRGWVDPDFLLWSTGFRVVVPARNS